MRVGQHSDVKHIVGVHWNSALEGERLENQRELPRRCWHQVLDIALKLGRPYRAGVYDMRLLTQVIELERELLADLRECPPSVCNVVMRQGVASTCFGKTSDQCFRSGIQKNGLNDHALVAQAFQFLRHLRQ